MAMVMAMAMAMATTESEVQPGEAIRSLLSPPRWSGDGESDRCEVSRRVESSRGESKRGAARQIGEA
jgi:hypothetical protein